ncbi:hypothetical protein L1D14_10415 [Vibrio tubiashii]|uniref:hypothetical protein n=1 Tax=Vibrio tubiashii TaxID=29498 RepID=UPI001EFE7CB9|nr:hypothetical protein [Vibrio tubiashii]MCG9576650.1 hypothetical protein [Vibrio tubiashii]
MQNQTKTVTPQTAVHQIKALSFRSRNKNVITIVSNYFALIAGLSNHYNKPSLESEWLIRFNNQRRDNPTGKIDDQLLSTLLDSRLPYLRVENENNCTWSPMEMAFKDFASDSNSISVKLHTLRIFDMHDLLGIANE